MTASKLSPTLVSKVETAHADDLVDVVLELQPADPAIAAGARSRSEKIAAHQEAFSRRSEPVESAIRQVGGEVIGSAWVNRTVRARVPARGLSHLSDLEPVAVLDVPHKLEPDFG